MRIVLYTLATLVLASAALTAQARNLKDNERFVCQWGSGIAGNAQAYKLSGISRYGARQKVQSRRFEKQWMRRMALGITEQTYDSATRMQPNRVKQIYFDDCIRHEMARR
ncbi:hypothetical protein [Pseudomonas sp. R5(2019)]|uniref:hypothetical protein n=1 Tax=Pseudomonas sp. R5(2019) TaxID=2697566 RepID=UPI00141293DE|nr:hypothetical protein [Pseudomonas sp. R5(2019)]NBA98027.1 hypothetical protein [Pseudomonas sp. R5(2019)]